MIDKHIQIIDMYDDWIRLKQMGLSLDSYFKENTISTIAIYGMNKLGYTLLDELQKSDVEVKYGIDKTLAGKHGGLPVRSPEEEWEEVDAVIVTAFPYWEDIYPLIKRKLPQADLIALDVLIRKILNDRSVH